MKSSSTLTPARAAAKRTRSPGHRRGVRLAGAITGVCLIAVASFIWTLATKHSDVAGEQLGQATVRASWHRPVVKAHGLEQRSGVRLVQVAVTGDGGLLDLRFQVVDPDTAGGIHDQKTPPAIVDEASGLLANELLMGHSHTAPFTAGVTYYLIFKNPGNVIQRGSTVSVLLGDAQVEHVLVR